MRMPKYLSPTSLKIFYDSREKYYLQYLADNRPLRDPQTEPMAVGSAFDAFVKNFLVQKLNGSVDPAFEFDTIFTAQVEEHNRDAALKAGRQVFEFYQKCGALADILLDLEGAVGRPRFETAIEGYVSSVSIALGDIPLLGKPDIYFITKKGARVIFDWKVNGYYSRHPQSPKPGYCRIRSLCKENGKQHPKAMVLDHNGVKIAASHPLCTVEKDWAAQLAIYAWLLGEDIGSRFIVAIDQIVCNWDVTFDVRSFKVAQHRSVVTEQFQRDLFEKAHKAWFAIQSGHIFYEIPREESDAKCLLLDTMANAKPDPAFDDLVR